MDARRQVCALALAFLFIAAPAAAETGAPGPGREYLGQTPPGDEPRIFAPGIVSTGLTERDVAVSPDGKEIYFGVLLGPYATIMVARYENGKWTDPEVAPFARDTRFNFIEPAFAPGGKRILFLSTRPPAGKEPKPGWGHQNLWAAERLPDGRWGDPIDLGLPVNTDDSEFYPSIARSGTLYFSRWKPGGGATSVWRSKLVEGRYAEPERLPDAVNGKGSPFNASIAPDESYLIACVADREDSPEPGVPAYHVFFRDPNDRWSDGIRLGEVINAPGSGAASASVSPDGRFLFFSASRLKPLDSWVKAGATFAGLRRLAEGPQNGANDIYWVDARVIERLRPRPGTGAAAKAADLGGDDADHR